MTRWVLVTVVIGMTVLGGYGAVRVAQITHSMAEELDRARGLARLAPRPQATIVYDRAGNPAFSFYSEQRTDVPLDRVSPHMISAILAVEDRRFFWHHGIDPFRIVAAAWRNLRAGRIKEGGSTITQQLARATQLSPVRTYERKIREIMIAARLEERFTKQEILEEYLNTVYFGEGYYGVEAASRGYFGKAALDLEPAEAALLAALVRSPSTDAPCRAPERARERRNLALSLMRDQDRLGAADARQAQQAPLPDESHQNGGAIGVVLAAANSGITTATGLYFQEEIRRQLVERFGDDKVLRGGLRVYSTYDPKMQHDAELAITARIKQIVKMRPSAKKLQGSLVAMDPVTGDVLALVGGRDFAASSFNRATQARRQAGSAFKPIIYAAALERGYAPGTLLRDLDVPIESAQGPWLPSGEHERTEYTVRRALKLSSNRAAAQLMQQVGVSIAVNYAHRLGIESDLPMVPSLALGTGEVTLLELTTAYSAFANHGKVATPRLILRVEDADGAVLHTAPERHVQAISPTTAYLMSSMLSDVVSSGTATGVRAAGFKLPAAGKTGTTDDYADAWFIGYTPHLLAGIWFGLDEPAPIMRRGFSSVVAVPAWGRFMKAATAGDKPDWYRMPHDVEKVAICRLSGARAVEACRHHVDYPPVRMSLAPLALSTDYRATTAMTMAVEPEVPAGPPVYEDLFQDGALPPETCQLHGAQPSRYGTSSDTAVAASSMTSHTPNVDAALRELARRARNFKIEGSVFLARPARTIRDRQ
jgi:1A family penicillin-binding protein